MKNRFRISQELKPYVRQLMSRSENRFRIKEEDGALYLYCDMSGTKFHNVVQRAKCMKLSEETGILHVTKRESEDNELVMSLQKEFNTHSYVIAGTQKS